MFDGAQICITWGGGILAILFINFAIGWVVLHRIPTNWITYDIPNRKPCCWLEAPVPNTTLSDYTCVVSCVDAGGVCAYELRLN